MDNKDLTVDQALADLAAFLSAPKQVPEDAYTLQQLMAVMLATEPGLTENTLYKRLRAAKKAGGLEKFRIGRLVYYRKVRK